MKRTLLLCTLLTALDANADPKEGHQTWSDPESALREDADFSMQGEYCSAETGTALGAQVVALGSGRFDIYLLEGGLPGVGWEPGKSRTLLKGERKGEQIECTDDSGKRKATLTLGLLSFISADGVKQQLTRLERRSPTLAAKAPEGAVILFDGSSADVWENGQIDNARLLATGCTSKQSFGSYTLHVEFRTPYKPSARGQQRGNSGIYHSGRWETQILDSFALEGKDNECGGIYSISKPRLNMALPPLAWQTYDVEFTAAQFDVAGKRTAWPRITVKLNGVLVHENLELAKDFTTSAPFSTPLDGPTGPIHLQNHGNPVQFRNIWILASQ